MVSIPYRNTHPAPDYLPMALPRSPAGEATTRSRETRPPASKVITRVISDTPSFFASLVSRA